MLPRQYRLTKRKDFRRVYNRSYSLVYPGCACYRRSNKSNLCRFGFSASKKLGNAVTRNRLKRRFRHAVYENRQLFALGYDYVFVIRRASLSMNHESLSEMIRQLATCFKAK